MMAYWFHGFVFLLGLCLGSFYNVCILRYLKEESILWPPSHCPSCGHKLKWWENIPLLSFILLRGKCSHCQKKISLLYPLVELISGIIALGLWWKYGWSLAFFLYLILFGLLIVASFIDLLSFLLPDILTLPGAFLALLFSFWLPQPGVKSAFLGAGAGFLLFLVIQKGYKWAKGIDGLGGGDVKLMLMLGALTGIKGLLPMIFVSALLALMGSVFFWLKGKVSKGESAIPYGPFLSLATVLYVFTGDKWWDIYRWLMGLSY